jgi:uncharacterized membrane protein
MSSGSAVDGLERRLGVFLSVGTSMACAVIAIGLVWRLLSATGGGAIVMTGIAIIIVLPIVRVAMMLCAFAKAHDYRFVAVAAVVLLLIGSGLLAGLNPAAAPGPNLPFHHDRS